MARKMLPAAAHDLLSFLLPTGGTRPPHPPPPPPPPRTSPAIHRRAPPSSRLAAGVAGRTTTLVVDVDGVLLLPRRRSLFPYFMLVALEAGGFLRGLLLLLLFPVIPFLYFLAGTDAAVRAMAAVAFFGLRAKTFRAGRAVLPRWLLEDVAAEALDAVRLAAGDPAKVVWVSSMPRVMVEPFLREYLQVPDEAAVVAREMKTVWGFYTGLMEKNGCHGGFQAMSVLLTKKNTAAGDNDDEDDVVGFSAENSMAFLSSPLASICKELYVVSQEEQSKWRPLPRRDYPKPLVFHDGRLAFLPTPPATIAMFMWLPLGITLSILRLATSLLLPYRHATLLHAATGQSWRLRGTLPQPPPAAAGELYACNHRTLIDPIYVSIALDRPVRAVSYSLSRVSDVLSPIGPTVHLARDRARDGAAMADLLGAGESVVVCPEGTTCREPYLLRFSPLFAELAGGVVPVALAVETSMFYGTTASGWKGVDPFYYLANPRMCYTVEFLERVETVVEEGEGRKKKVDSIHVANRVQGVIAKALGYECTMLTRKDKYRMLVGNDGAVAATPTPRRGCAGLGVPAGGARSG